MARRRRVALVTMIVVLVAAIPAVLFAAIASSKLDRFLELRESTLNKLHHNATSLPAGVEHRMPQDSAISPTIPERRHIASVIANGDPWYQDGHRSYELVFSDEVAARPAGDIAMMLTAHFANGLETRGLRSPVRGRAGFTGAGRGTQGQWWRDAEGQIIVTLSVVVDNQSNAAHVDEFVHERFD